MKGVKGRFLKKLKFVPTINTLKHAGLALHKNSSQRYPSQKCQSPQVYKEEDDHGSNNSPEVIVCNLNEEIELEFHVDDKENFTPSSDTEPGKDDSEAAVSSEITMQQNTTHEAKKENEDYPISLTDFEEKCPPGGEDSVIFYTTSLRGIRKTFEDCSTIRFLLESFKISFQERDVSLHMEFRDELWRLLSGRVIPAKLFIKGRYIGGADEVVGLHEQGKLKKLLQGIPVLSLSNSSCNGCGNISFVVCFNCNGSCKVFNDGDNDEMFIRCPECNENGLVKCPICC